MRTIIGLALVLSLGLASMIVSMSGLPGVFGLGPQDPGHAAERLNETADNESLGVRGSPGQEGQGDIAQFIINAGAGAVEFVATVLLLPLEFQRLGAPWYAAYPAGLGLQILAIFGGWQFFAGRRWV